MSRLDTLRLKLAKRTKPDGAPLHGYEQNVAAIRAEIARLETAR